MKIFNLVDIYKNDQGEIALVVFNDREREKHDFKDLFPKVQIDNVIYNTERVISNQIYMVRKNTRILIYTKELN